MTGEHYGEGVPVSVWNDFVTWVRGIVGYVALALAGGTLFALQMKAPTVRAWVAVLLKSVIVGVLAGPAITASGVDESLHWVLIACIAFFADAILFLLSGLAQKMTKHPGRFLRVLAWAAGRSIPAAIDRELDDEAERRDA